MGTRNLTAVMVDGSYKLAQYGQWDGYPEGQGRVALVFARTHLTTAEGRETFKRKLGQVRFTSPDEHKALWKFIGVTESWVTSEQSSAFNEKWPYFSRDHGAQILQLVMDADGAVLTSDSIDFVRDSVFCEWAYVIDLDKNTFEVFRGFNTEPLPSGDRFAGYTKEDITPSASGATYYPIKHSKSWLLEDLPSEEAFLRFFEEKAKAEAEAAEAAEKQVETTKS